MRKKTFRWVPALPALAMAFAFGGCGSSVTHSSSSSGAQPTTITVWDYSQTQPGYQKAEHAIDQAFMAANPTIKVIRKTFPYSAYTAKLRTALSAGQGPDVVFDLQDPSLYAYFRPLRSLLTPTQRADVGFLDSSMASDPGLHGIPWTTYGYFWAYNKALFKRAALNPDQPPTTFPALLGACTQLKHAGITPISGGFQDGYLADWFVFWGLSDQLLNPSQTLALYKNWSFLDPKVAEGARYLMDLQRAGCFGNGDTGATMQDAENAFRGGKTAMNYTCCATPSLYRQFVGKGNAGAFLMPRLPDSSYATPFMDMGPSAFWYITKASHACVAAWKYISFYVGTKGETLTWSVGQVPPNNVTATPRSTDPLDSAFLRWLKIPGGHMGAGPTYAAASAAMDKLWPEVLAGRVSVTSALHQAQAAQSAATSNGAPPGAGGPACT